MHAAILHFAPILGAEKSKTPFYIAGGVLVAWALLVSVVLGMRQSDFPGTAALQRLVMAVSAALVLATVSMAVLTSGGSPKAQASPATAATPATQGQPPGAEQGAPGPAPGSGHERGARSTSPAGSSTTLAEAADPSGQLHFTSAQLSARAGKVTIDFTNHSPLAHNFTLAQGSTIVGHTPTIQGTSKTLTVNLKPGAYKFFCTVPGHREAGMEGTLTVS